MTNGNEVDKIDLKPIWFCNISDYSAGSRRY